MSENAPDAGETTSQNRLSKIAKNERRMIIPGG